MGETHLLQLLGVWVKQQMGLAHFLPLRTMLLAIRTV